MVDWNQTWKDAFLASRLTSDNYYDNEEQAKSYDAAESIWADGKKRAADLDPGPSWSVLDIGSGPGILTVPLARTVREVTAIEPSRPMISCLKRHLDEESISNVGIINSRWEDVSAKELEPHDLVIGSYSLSFEDIKDALLKMDRLAKKRVVLYWFAGTTNWELIREDLFSQVYGRKPVHYPKCNVIYNLLYDLGLYPDAEVLHGTSFSREYARYDQALSYLRSTLGVFDTTHDELLHNYIESHWRRDDGRLFMEDKTTYVKLSWRPKGTR
ncbi:MAG: class I SAM-dependent methyltransferase [Methanotrichaceae archaeon]|nr:class I SAM-dependent methyltransferase [Methanotrichaceae archaeon]